jgi:NAD(P)H dehydrogenase (quinone)
MKIFVVLAHPRSDSFNAALCEALCHGIHKAGHETDVADLCADGFDPVLRGTELNTLGTGPPLPDVASYQQRILQAQAMAFIFPVWWFGVPAILKGFVDRVFQEEFAFRFTSRGQVKGLLQHEKALVACTAGMSASLYRLFRFGRPLEKTFVDWTLKICGIRRVRYVIFHDVVNAGESTRAGYLKEMQRLGRRYFR